jgi:hypothetical protein
MGGPGMGGPGMRGQQMGGRGIGGGPGMRRQRMGGPGVASRPGMQRHGLDVSPEELADFPTNVRVVEVDEFDPTSFDELAPLIVKGAVARASKKWTDEWLLQHFGSVPCQVQLDSRPVSRGFTKYMTFGEYQAKSKASDGPRGYVFQPKMELAFEGGDDELLEDLDVPAAIWGLGKDRSWWLAMGPALSGILPHDHRAALNVLARGRKRWAIYVSTQGENGKLFSFRDYGSGSQAKDWFARECPKLRSRRNVRLWECVQAAGDLLYVPAYFIHAVVNLEPVVGFSINLFQPQESAWLAAHRRKPMLHRPPPRSLYMRKHEAQAWEVAKRVFSEVKKTK